MGSVNVNRNLSDQFYRYKMPRIIAKVEGKGNGIKTVLVNMGEVAKALNRPATYPTKYFGCELGAQTQLDTKNDRYIVNGAHEAGKLQDILDGFIRRYVLCSSCSNPETVLAVLARKGIITTKCRACGYSGTLETNHKLNTYILKNPPPSEEESKLSVAPGSSKKGKRKSRDEKKGAKTQNGTTEDVASSPPGDSDAHDGHGDHDDGHVDGTAGDDDDWGEDTSEAAKARRMEALTTGAKGLMLDDDLDKSEQERMDIFYNFVKARLARGLDGKEVFGEAERLEVRDKAPLVLCELLFDEGMATQVVQHRALLLRFTHGSARAQRYLLGGFEQVVREHSAVLLPRVPHVLKALYDRDILEEEAILDWAKKCSKKYVSKEMAQEIHEKAKPFIKWLQEAEEEESSEEEDAGSEDENVEVVYSDRHISTSIQEVKEEAKPVPTTKAGAPAAPAKAGRDEDDDLDIDAI